MFSRAQLTSSHFYFGSLGWEGSKGQSQVESQTDFGSAWSTQCVPLREGRGFGDCHSGRLSAVGRWTAEMRKSQG